jgi:hypothetical protein
MAASTTIITDLTTADTTGPSATTLANSNSAAGPIMDVRGNINLALLKAKELKELLNNMLGAGAHPTSIIDGSDPIKTNLNNVLLSLV